MMDQRTFESIDKLHVLFGLALHDLKLATEDRELEINMGVWTRPSGAGICQVCMAGAVLIKSLGWPKTKSASFLNDVPEQTRRRLYVIDELRVGNVKMAYERLYGTRPNEGIGFPRIPDWEERDSLPWAKWCVLADYLKHHDI